MLIRIAAALGGWTLSLFLALIGPASAGNFDGWCFPANDCTGEPSPIANDSFSTCEEKCELNSLSRLEGLDAYLYQVSCMGDHLSEPSRDKQIFMRYDDFKGEQSAVIFSSDGITQLSKCGDAQPLDTEQKPAPADASCPLDKSVWKSGTDGDYTTFRYVSSPSFFLSGSVTFEKSVGGELQWTVNAPIECSNGVPFCSLELPIAGRTSAVSIPVDMVTPDGFDIIEAGPDAGVPFVIFSQLRLSTFRWINYSVEPIRVKATFEPASDSQQDVVLPSVYKFSDCRN